MTEQNQQPTEDTCAECGRLATERAKAEAERDRSRQADVAVLTRRHMAACHAGEWLQSRLAEVNARSRAAR
ncbi:hypothetical protein [Streptantibioticus ferralitis]|uniref:Uncharacterized protein n=1 Tax=Streptantibioticus ferralitis TaxID=236510 RepID=A0ABT5YY97_9ACTN|nr:hypothetical protein [Streptantibioticus ferralitis]MDF2255780.1 hypothetical protein [Streptantibioticus ferralitis]